MPVFGLNMESKSTSICIIKTYIAKRDTIHKCTVGRINQQKFSDTSDEAYTFNFLLFKLLLCSKLPAQFNVV